MTSESNNNILPLESFDLTAVPTSTHNIAWSPDAELAIGCDDCVFVFLPEYSRPRSEGAERGTTLHRQYNAAALRFPSVGHRDPELNRPLFDLVGQDFPEYEHIPGGAGGSGPVASQGSSMNHVVALEWSPCGLGRMDRSVLAVLTGAGTITMYLEAASDGMNAFKLHGGNTRGLKPWLVAWGVGTGLLLPVAEGHIAQYTREYITAFSWSKDTDGHGALLAYANDEDDVVIVSVQAKHDSKAAPGDCGLWRVEEVPTDPDYSPSGSSFSLSWGPWLKRGTSKTCMLSYIAKNYVGFRQVTIKGTFKSTKTPNLEIDPVDSNGICLHLAPDAFMAWEELIWTVNGSKVCRGIVATPTRVQALQVAFDSTQSGISEHTTDECGTTYPEIDNGGSALNPITGLVVHPPSLSHAAPTLLYSLVRLSATHENDGWYQTNLPLPPNPEDGVMLPQWVNEIDQIIEHRLPRRMAYRPSLSSDDGSADLEGGSDNEDMMGGGSDVDSHYDSEQSVIAGLDTSDQVHINRARIWGMAASPGGGVIAVFISRHSALIPERDTYGGATCRVLFGKHGQGMAVKKLSTEAKMWEWMYGGGHSVPGVDLSTAHESGKRSALKDHFALIARRQACAFCDLPLSTEGKFAKCSSGHFFATCATTGLPILAPGVSRTCNVCASQCLKREDLISMAPQLKEIILDEISSELCGGCGGKFIN
ncbi:hypothetical protein GGS23DRAFT_598070 [Durotheca rogersii]|uniref:uncharacterized protein n=1 Tax=Durotheca rogersii TaxID=419775 RepID=UPI00222031D1|nr:uncharacterized protein GGS23DRAFT_598070 [Durotheca rogersii]KAI5862056.1 hypothetical protein GGS23DRAFT_598070 [Durotheca rogersii]